MANTTPTALGYSRVSTCEQALSGLGIDAQHARLTGWAAMTDTPIELLDENGVSGTLAPEARPVLGPALARLADPDDAATVLVAAKVDRLGRDVADVLALADRAEAEGGGWVVVDVGRDTNTTKGRMRLTMRAALGRGERDMTAQRTTGALASLKARGVRLGRPVADVTRRVGRWAEGLAAGERPNWSKLARELNRMADDDPERWAKPSRSPWSGRDVKRAVETVRLDAEAARAAETT